MKKVFFLAAATAMMVTACQTKDTSFVLTASELPAELNNTYAYVVENRESVDSVLITNGAFEMTIDSLTPDMISYISMGETAYFSFIKEAGKFKVMATEDGLGNKNYSVVSAKGDESSLNNKLSALIKSLNDASAPIMSEYQKKYEMLANGENLPEDSIAMIQNEMEELSTQMEKETNTIAAKCYKENKDNVVGVTAFSYMSYEDDADFVKAYEGASEAVKADKRLKNRYENIKMAMSTQVGAQYVDFTMEDGQGNTAKLSDYLADGRYLLVDFWASWCGPCRKAMPHLADINKKHAAKVRVLSVGTWEQSIEDNNKAKEELGMTWDTFFDSKNVGTTSYGVTGIPTLLLISPEGEILVRTHSPEDIDAKIAELKL